MSTIFDQSSSHGGVCPFHVEHFRPSEPSDFRPVSYQPGSPEKVEELARRVEQGFPLLHREDLAHHNGYVGHPALKRGERG